MKKRMMIALALALCLLAPCALAQTLPGVEVFSPGLMRVGALARSGEGVRMRATMTAEDVAYARDLSVLRSMLSGTEFAYAGWGGAERGADSLRIERDGQTLLSLGLERSEDGAVLDINGEPFAVDPSSLGGAAWAADALAGASVLERVPLSLVCEAIEALSEGDALPGGFAVTQAFTVERTMSDDGARLTKIDIRGGVAREGEAPWMIEGYMRQPGGRSPKDTFELTARQDEDNELELTYSSLRKSEITRKDRAGSMNVDTTLRAVGKLEGCKFSSRLTVNLRNAWTADGESLNEKITVNAALGQTDKRPGKRFQRLNDISAKLRLELALTTQEARTETALVDEHVTASVVLDGHTFLDAAAQATLAVGGEGRAQTAAGAVATPAEANASARELRAAFDRAIVQLAQRLYAQLGDSAKEKIESGL